MSNATNKWTRDQKIQGWLLAAAVFYGFITAALWWTTREGIHSGQRAYLIVDHIRLEHQPEVGKEINATLEIRNTGQTPALKVTASIIAEMFISEPDSHRASAPAPEVDIGAGQVQPMGTRRISPLTADEASDIIKEFYVLKDNAFMLGMNVRRLYVSGIVRYIDVFGGQNEMEFCLLCASKHAHS